MSFSSWNEASEHAVSVIFQLARPNAKPTLAGIRGSLDDFIKDLWPAPGGNEKAVASFCNLGADALEHALASGITFTADGVHKVLVRKQNDYGPENIRRFGRQGLMVRLHDKVARLENLTSSGKSPNNESIEDTFLDIIGYCAIGIMWEQRNFLLPLDK
jgi:intein/homing endonuclease